MVSQWHVDVVGIGVILVDAQQVASGDFSKPPEVVVCVSVKFSKIRSHSEVSPRARGCCNPELAPRHTTYMRQVAGVTSPIDPTCSTDLCIPGFLVPTAPYFGGPLPRDSCLCGAY